MKLLPPPLCPSLSQLHRTITDFERQKLDQEQRHAKHVQQVVSDCGNRIDQMERDRTSQISTSVSGWVEEGMGGGGRVSE